MKYSEQEMVSALQSVHNGSFLSESEYNRLKSDDMPSTGVIKKYIGWNEAKRRAGLGTVEASEWSKEFDETFFDAWNSRMSYWVGYLFGDGCVRRRSSGGDRLSLRSKDRIVIKQFKDDIGAEHDIVQGPEGYYSIAIVSDKVVERLSCLGLDEKKTHTGTIPDVPEEYRGDFVRGIYDADGTLGEYEWVVYGNTQRLEKLSKWLPCKAVVAEYDGLGRLRVSDESNLKTLEKWINGSPKLNRKYPITHEQD